MYHRIALALALIVAPAAFADPVEDREEELQDAHLDDVKTSLFPVVQHERDGDRSETKVANVIVGEGVHHERHGTRSEFEVLDLPLFTLMESETGENSHEVNFVKAPFTRVFSSESDGESHETRVLDVPFFSLLESERDDDGDVSTTFVKLPIVGALFKHSRSGDKEKVRFLFFSHTRRIDEDREARPAIAKVQRTGSRRAIR